MKPRIGILTSGGDCPGLNAVLRGVALAAEKLGWEVVGFRDGFEGLLPPGDYVILDRHSTDGIMALGGTMIGTTNRGHFIAKVGAGDRAVMAVEVMGRHAGWIALHGGIAGGADIILIPEIPFDFEKIATSIRARDAAG